MQRKQIIHAKIQTYLISTKAELTSNNPWILIFMDLKFIFKDYQCLWVIVPTPFDTVGDLNP